MVPLGEVVRHRKEFVQIDDLQQYKRCRVQLHAQGVVLRDIVPGAEVKTKTQQVCRKGEFLVAEIDAKVGGFGIVPADLDGAVVSSHYFLFVIDEARLDRGFLDYYIRTPAFREQVGARGSTNYAAIRPSHVLGYTLPLPPLPEQRRIVAKIDELAGRIAEARGLHTAASENCSAVRPSAANEMFDRMHRECQTVALGDIAEIRSGVTLGRGLRGPTVTLPYLRVANVQDGRLDLRVVKTVPILPAEREKWRLVPGDVLLTEGGDWDKLGRGTIWSGEIADCIHQNHIFRVRVDPAHYDPTYIVALTSSPYGREYFGNASKQTTNLASINQRQLRAFPVFCVDLVDQRRIVAYLDDLQAKVDRLKELQAQAAAELDALLPAILDKAFKGAL
jgi:type I restriction enzyme S subunit